MFSKIALPAIAVASVAADLPVVEVSLAGAGSWSNALSAMEKNRETMENRFVAQLQQTVSAMEKASAPATAKAISNVLDLNTALFATEKDTTAVHAALVEAPTSLRVRVSDSAAAAELVDMVAKNEAKLNAREEQLFHSALVALEGGAAPSSMFLESQSAGDQEFAVKVTGSGSLAFVDTVKAMQQRRAAKLREIRNFVSGVVAQLSQKAPSSMLAEAPSSMTSFPEFNVQYYSPAAAASLHGATEANSFAAAVDDVLAKQTSVIESLEKSAHRAFFTESSPKVTQSPMVWLNLRGAAHASLVEQPMGPSEMSVNVFEAPRSMLLSPEKLSGGFEAYDFFVESGSSLPGAASLKEISEKSDAMSHKSFVELPGFNVHVAQGATAQAVQLSEAQQSAIMSQRTRLIQALKERSARLTAIRAALSQ